LKGIDYFRELLGIKVHEVRDGYAKMSLEIDKKTLALCSVIIKKGNKDVAMFSGLAYKIQPNNKD
jgi:hypothetical protein